MTGTRIEKPVTDFEKYTGTVLWCNANKAVIEDRGDCYETVALPDAPEPAQEEAKAARRPEINRACDRLLTEAAGVWPDTEVLASSPQSAGAKAYQASGNAGDAPLLAVLARWRGIALDNLAQRVTARHRAFSVLSGTVIGQRQAQDRLDARTTGNNVRSLAVEIVVPD